MLPLSFSPLACYKCKAAPVTALLWEGKQLTWKAKLGQHSVPQGLASILATAWIGLRLPAEVCELVDEERSLGVLQGFIFCTQLFSGLTLVLCSHQLWRSVFHGSIV